MAMAFDSFLGDLRASWVSQSGSRRELRNLIVLRRVDSTQSLSRRLHQDYKNEDGEVPPVAVVAYEQVGGRGRQGRSWESPEGRGVYATLIRPVESPKALRLLPLAVAVALAEALDAILDRPCGLRWPNDLMVDGSKIGGILVDAVARQTDEDRNEKGSMSFIGFGINHSGTPVPGISACVREHCELEPSLAELTEKLLLAVDAGLSRLEDEEDLLRRYTEGSIHEPGETLRCRVGDQVKVGTFEGFAAGGYLRLKTEKGVELLTSGAIVPSQDSVAPSDDAGTPPEEPA